MALASEESRVLVIFTGGTIGMLVGDSGYVPEPFFLFETLRSQTSRFHDPLGDSLLSKSRNVEGFRKWSETQSRNHSKTRSRHDSPLRRLSPSGVAGVTGEPTSPVGSGSKRMPFPVSDTLHKRTKSHPLSTDQGSARDQPPSEKHPDPLQLFPSETSPPSPGTIHHSGPATLLVRSSRPIQAPPLYMMLDEEGEDGRGRHNFQCRKIRENCYEMHLPSLVTPAASSAPGGNVKRIRYAVLEWNPLLDSSNMEIADWIRIAEEIELNYHLFDAFVVLHGTDTMCYSSSALSFLLEDLGKTVILTGAQIPLSQLRNDAVENLLGALSIAGQYVIPECSLFFNHTLYRGNRVSKMSSSDLDAFQSPNFSPLAKVGIDIEINWSDVVRPTSQRPFKAHKNMCPNVATLRLFPGITAATVRAFLAPPVQGVVLETYGAGNAPSRPDLLEALREACQRGVVIVAISQCAKGSVSDAYETGRTLQSVGIASGGDMTTECALSKLAYLLSKADKLSGSEIHALMQIPLRGELTLPPASSIHAPPTAASEPSSSSEIESFSNLLNHIARLSLPGGQVPSIQVSEPQTGRGRPVHPKPTPSMTLLGSTVALSKSTREITRPWANTANETASAEAALYPFLVHLAVAKDDVDTLRFCLGITERSGSPSNIVQSPVDGIDTSADLVPTSSNRNLVTGGMANCLDVASGRTPLHVAALNGSVRCAKALLEVGALIHIRDSLDHTALYYAARHSHGSIVDLLLQAGAHLGGADVEGGYVRLAIKLAQSAGDLAALAVWAKTGAVIYHNSTEAV